MLKTKSGMPESDYQQVKRPFDFPVRYHVIGWLIFIGYEVLVYFFFTKKWPAVSLGIVNYGINIALFYANIFLVFRQAYRVFKKPVPVVLLLLLVEVVIYLSVAVLVGNYQLASQGRAPVELIDTAGLARAFWRGFYFLFFSIGYWTITRSIDRKKKLYATRNAFLQSQLSPHLLFNTLNYIYNCVYERSEDAAKAVMLLSDVMRFSIDEVSEAGKVKLAHEIAQIRNLVELHQLRVRSQFNLETRFETDNPEAEIIPLVLLSLVENVFKHGNFSEPGKNAVIQILLREGKLEFYSSNPKKLLLNPGTGMGISNNITRLERYYPGKFSLSLRETPEHFEVDLKIDL